MIYATVNMTVGVRESTCDSKIVLYRGDRNVEVRFVIKGNRFTILDSTCAQMLIKRPSATSLFSEPAPIQNNTVIFTITEEMIDELKEIGEYTFQIRLFDDDMNARATLPPCNSCLVIERPIATEEESVVNLAEVGNSAVMLAEFFDEGDLHDAGEDETFDLNGNYNKTTWVEGDLITDVRLNKIEDALHTIQGVNLTQEEAIRWLSENGGGGGGGGSASVYISTEMELEAIVKTGETFPLTIDYSSNTNGNGTLKVVINDVDKVSKSIEQGQTTTIVPASAFSKGSNVMRVYVIDRRGNMSNSITFHIRYGGTEIVGDFDSTLSYDYGATVRYYFTPTCVDTSLTLTFYMSIDGQIQNGVPCTSDVRGYYTFPNGLAVGAHPCEAWIEDSNGEISNILTFNLVILDNSSIVVSSQVKTVTIEEGEQVSLDFKVYKKNASSFITKTYEDGVLVNTGTCGLTTAYYKSSDLSVGTHLIRVDVWDLTETVSGSVSWTVNITESAYTLIEPTNAGSTFIASAKNKTNVDQNKELWIGHDQDNLPVNANLYNFSFDEENGWINDRLYITGNSYVEVPLTPLANNARYGFTLDIEFMSKSIGVETAEVLSLWDDAKECGIKITSEELIIQSADGNRCDLYFTEEEMVNAIFVIDRNEKTAKIYLNGVMCEAFALSDYIADGVAHLEDFAVNDKLYLGGKNSNGYCAIENLRIYDIALGTDEILNNFISTITDKAKQQALVEFQKGSSLPTMTIYCDFSGLGKDDKKPCNIVYNSPDPAKYGDSFSLLGKYSELQYQGTSSMQYPIKNYRINPRDAVGKVAIQLPNCQPETRFTLKADFMSSGHWQNTGLTKWVNDNLYNYNTSEEKSMNPAKWWAVRNGIDHNNYRECIYGFPCRLILVNDGTTSLNEGQAEPTPGNTKDMGIFNFNLDKDCENSLGFTIADFPYAISMEVTANSDTSAGAFISYQNWNGDKSTTSEIDYLKQSFELRYVNNDTENFGYLDMNGDTDRSLKRVIDWVDNCTDEEFIEDFEFYFHKDYTLRYYLLVITLGMVDNLGKNMMFDSYNGMQWMPRFYDCDTICSYDNSGAIKFDVDIEMEQGYWNTSSSRLWTRIRDLFHDELVAKYNDMRQNGMSYESFMQYFYDEQIAKIPQRYYNMDFDVKYAPYADEYMGKAHGDGYEHLKRWLKNRLIFTDSLFDYAPSYSSDMLTIRANTTQLMHLTIETYTPVYQHVSWYNGNMEKEKINKGTSVTFSGYAQTATDQEVLIYGGSNVKRISGISSMNPDSMLIGNATKLVELDISGCPILTDINSNKANLSGHAYLNNVDLSDCPQLGGTLRLNNSPLVQEIDIENTAISGLLLPPSIRNLEELNIANSNVTELTLRDNDFLESLSIPGTITSITFKNLNKLTNVRCASYANLKTLNVENMNLDFATILAQAVDIEYVRMIGIDCRLAIMQMQNLMEAKGLDINGNVTDIGQAVSGKITLSSCTPALETTIKDMFPLVEFTILSYVEGFTVKFYDGNGKVIYQDEVVVGGTAVYKGPTPTKTTTAQYTYTFRGWNMPLGPITSNTSIWAEFEENLRYYTIRFLYPSTDELIDSQYLAYGSTPVPPIASYDYEGWTPDITTVTKDAEYYAKPLPQPEDMTIFSLTKTTVNGVEGYDCKLLDVSNLLSQVIFPSIYGGLPVLSISGVNTTSYKSKIASVVIPPGIQVIGDYAFYGCTNLNKTNDGAFLNKTEIGAYAFYNCRNLKKDIDLTNVTKLGTYAFYAYGNYSYSGTASCPTTITLGPQITEIPNYCFYDAWIKLKNINNIVSIGLYGMGGSSGRVTVIDEVVTFDNLTTMDNYAFWNTDFEHMPDVMSFNNLVNITSMCLSHSQFKAVRLPKITELPGGTNYRDNYYGIVDSSTISFIELGSPEYPFTTYHGHSNDQYSYGYSHTYNAGAIAFIHMVTANGVKEDVTFDGQYDKFDEYYFIFSTTPKTPSFETIDECKYCILGDEVVLFSTPSGTSSSHINYVEPDSIGGKTLTKVNHRVFGSSYKYFDSIIFKNLTTVPRETFSNSTATTIDLGKVTYIPYECISNNAKVVNFTANYVTELSHSAFYNINSLKKVSLPAITTLKPAKGGSSSSAFFYSCGGLETIELPNVTTIESDMRFADSCSKLYYIRFGSDTSPVTIMSNSTLSYQCNNLATIHFVTAEGCVSVIGASGASTTYYSTRTPKTFVGQVSDSLGNSYHTFTDGTARLVAIGAVAQTNGYTVPDDFEYTVTSIGGTASLNTPSITAPDLEYISPRTFYTISTITTINAPKLEVIDTYAFSNATGLTSITTSNLRCLGNNAITSCRGLTSLDLSNLEYAGSYACAELPKLTTLGSTDKLKTVGSQAFNNLPLTSYSFPVIESIPRRIVSNTGTIPASLDLTFGSLGHPITSAMINSSAFGYANASSGAVNIKIYTSDGNMLVGQPWGGKNCTFTYYQA